MSHRSRLERLAAGKRAEGMADPELLGAEDGTGAGGLSHYVHSADTAPRMVGTLRSMPGELSHGKYAGKTVPASSMAWQVDTGSSEESGSELDELNAKFDAAMAGASSDSDSDGSEEDARSDSSADELGEAGVDDVDDEIAALEAQDAAAITAMSKSSKADVARARVGMRQVTLHEAWLEARIRAQPALASAAQLPVRPVWTEFRDASPVVQRAMSNAVHQAEGLLVELCEAWSTLLSEQPAIHAALRAPGRQSGHSSTLIPAGVKRGRDATAAPQASCAAWWQVIETGLNASADWQAQVLDSVATSAAVQASGFKALRAARQEQSESSSTPVTSALQAVLADADKVVRRAAAPAASVRMVGCQPRTGVSRAANDTAAWCEDVYDDTDFYQGLLREFVANATASGHADKAAGVVPAKHKSVKRDVDRRASKGRKIRYFVHDKMVNFAAPTPLPPLPDDAAPVNIDQLVSSLFKA